MALWLVAGACLVLVLLTALGLALWVARRRRQAKPLQARAQASTDSPAAEKNRMLGLALQGQGQLDLAFDHFRRAPPSPALRDNLNHLAQEFEQKHQFKKAQAVWDYMATPSQGGQQVLAAPEQVNLAEAGSGLPSGTLLGRFQVTKVLGKGAMGVVYLGQDTSTRRPVALKTMALDAEFEGANLLDARDRFFREAETASRLKHPNIVTIEQSGEDRGLAYIAMEFIEGQDLTAHCRVGHLLALPLVLSIVARVAEALAYAHSQQVVHRDIKPANVMYDIQNDMLKVTDFGIARLTDANKTRTGLVLGTPSFMSPEQLAGKKVDGRSDLYSLGVMLFQMLTGSLPFRGNSLAVLMHKITHERAPDLRGVLQGAPPELAELVARALEKDPQTRYQDGQKMAHDLRELLLAKKFIDLEI